MVEVLLTLDCPTKVLVALGPAQPFQVVSLSKSRDCSLPVFPCAPREMAGDTNIKCAIGPVGNNIDPFT
jgi:hypothetical protein